jgi:MFS family permease
MPRASWRGFLRLSLVSCPIYLSVFFVLVMIQRFSGDASYAIIGPYIAEVWPNRLRASGMGFSYGIGNLGKIIGPLGLALVVGSSDLVSPKATIDALFPAFLFLAFWYGQAALMFLLLGFETKGRSIEEINRALDTPAGIGTDTARVPRSRLPAPRRGPVWGALTRSRRLGLGCAAGVRSGSRPPPERAGTAG